MTLGLIALSFLIILGLIAGILDLRFRDFSNLSLYTTIVGFILAFFCSYVFPKWTTITLLKPSIVPGKTELIEEYVRDPGSMFLYITLGYSGLMLCVYAPPTTMHDPKWIVGFLLLFCYFQGLLTPFIGLKKD